MAAHEKQIKVDLPLLTSLLARPSIYIYLFWYHPAAFLFLDPGYCCAVTNAHWGAIGRIKSTKLLLAMNYVLIGRVFGEVKPGMIMKSAIVVMPFKLFQIIFMYH